jgi:hypothetical protein
MVSLLKLNNFFIITISLFLLTIFANPIYGEKNTLRNSIFYA